MRLLVMETGVVGERRGYWKLSAAPLGLPNDQALSRSLHDCFAHLSQGIDFENSFHLCEQPAQQAEVAPSDADDRRDGLRVQRELGKMDTGRLPPPVQQFSNRSGIQGPKFMDESDPGIELRVTCQALFDARHSDQDQTDIPAVEDIPDLLKPRDFEPVRFVNYEQSRGIRHAGPYSHRAIPLLIESILGVACLSTSISIWVLFGIA